MGTRSLGKNKKSVSAYCTVLRVAGWVLMTGGVLAAAISAFQRPMDARIMGYMALPRCVVGYLYPGIIALVLAQLITYIFDGEYRPRWLLRRADMVMYLYAVLVLLGSTLHYIYITILVSNYDWRLLSLSILLPAAAKCVIVIGLGRLLRSVLPMIEESRTLV